MVASKTNTGQQGQAETEKQVRRYRFELSVTQFFVYSLCLVLILTWMFAFGVMVGRGIPLVDSKDFSLRAEIMRFVGLGRETPPPPENAAETWESSKEILDSLDYYEDLTQRGGSGSADSARQAAPSHAAPVSPAAKEPSDDAAEHAEKASTSKPVRATSQKSAPETSPPESFSEHFTLLVGSLREPENAQRMVEQLRAKGYAPRMESLDLSESGRWNRVLVGSFPSREEAMKFAAEFNRKEHMEGLVIRESN